MRRPIHHLIIAATVVVTLVLLLLGSVVHATESSLACPDWPTCFGTMMPAMEGGVFWEHSHRLVAGLVLLLWVGATAAAWRAEEERPWVRWAAVAGLGLLLGQAVLGGLTVIYRLPDPISVSHLGAAYLFLGLAVALTVVTSPRWGRRPPHPPGDDRFFGRGAAAMAALVFLQSLLGAWVRHADAGMACIEFPFCRGEVLPELAGQPLLALHWSHRMAGIAVGIAVVTFAVAAVVRLRSPAYRTLAVAAGAAAVAQAALGYFSVATILGVTAVSLHTLFAALLIAILVGGAVRAAEPASGEAGDLALG